MTNAINWFEIPATDFTRAKKFYETILGIEIMEMPFPQGKYGMFPADMENGAVGGGLMQSEGFNPSNDGAVVYLNGGEDLSVSLSKVEQAGGKIIMPKTSIGQNGFMAHFIDTEGNRLALHSMM
jgi:predicted enzyme related to lactoylglutathione lyase